MIIRTIEQIGAMCGAIIKGGDKSQLIHGVKTDSRATSGELFVPLAGDRFDGHDFVLQAIETGAKAVMWKKGKPVPEELRDFPVLHVRDPLYSLQQLAGVYRNELPTRVVGITGSNGKTTTKDMTAALLSTQYKVHKTEGNLNNHIGLPLTLLAMDEDTEVAVLEMGMSGFGEIELLTQIAQPDIAIITNIGDAHMLQLGSRNGIAKAKLEIVKGLSETGVLLYNGDEPLLPEEMENMDFPANVQKKTFGLGEQNEWSASDIELDPFGSQFVVQYKGGTSNVGKQHIAIPGRHNISNALAAIAAARLFGVPATSIGDGFSNMQISGMRIEPMKAWNGATILNDAYNANPTATKAAIDLVEGLSGFAVKWIVLGDMLELGPEEESMHIEIGRYLTPSKADRVLTYGPLSTGIAAGASTQYSDNYVMHFDDRDTLTEWLKQRLSPQDLVLVKGSRGMRMEQIVEALERG